MTRATGRAPQTGRIVALLGEPRNGTVLFILIFGLDALQVHAAKRLATSGNQLFSAHQSATSPIRIGEKGNALGRI